MPQCVRLEGAKGCSTRHEKCEEGPLMLREAPTGFANHKRIRKMLVGAVGIEFAVNPISPADSVTLAPLLPLAMQLVSRILWPRCGQLHKPR